MPTSEATAAQARALGVPLATLEEQPELDLTIDGADEVDGALRLIKGGGGALLREKIVAAASKRMVVIADASKQVERLGAFPLPRRSRAVRPGGDAPPYRSAPRAALGRSGEHRAAPRDGRRRRFRHRRRPLHSRLRLRRASPTRRRWLRRLHAIPGVVEHGLFIGLAERRASWPAPDGVEILGDLA